jgi:DNA repair photolyase
MKQVFGTKEWAEHSFNCISGCTHGCRYCYASKMAIRYGRKKDKNDWLNEVYFNKVKLIKKLKGRVMFPTTHDITPKNISLIIPHIEKHLAVGNELLIVSKPHFECIKKITDYFKLYREKIMFRFSIGAYENKILKFWEPFAPGFEERLEALKYAFLNGYETSVSCEPLLTDDYRYLISLIEEYVSHSIWIGKMNNHLDNDELAKYVKNIYTDKNIMAIYEHCKNNPLIKWKESFKKVIGIEVPEVAGMDI